jgi:uncharacterized protein YjiS (DUF1127 family)
MNTIVHPSSPALPGVRGALQRVVSGLHWLRIAHAERRRTARARQDLGQLDEHALRDLGLTRGELDSYAAEARGAVAKSRRRVDDPHGWSP